MKRILQDTEQTEQLGAFLWQCLPSPCLVFLSGDLGAGKTTLVRGFLRAAGYTGTVKSPTYTLVEEYNLPDHKFYHFDLYRLTDPEELEWLGIRDYIDENAMCFIEWPERGQGVLPQPDLWISLAVDGGGRSAVLECLSDPVKKIF